MGYEKTLHFSCYVLAVGLMMSNGLQAQVPAAPAGGSPSPFSVKHVSLSGADDIPLQDREFLIRDLTGSSFRSEQLLTDRVMNFMRDFGFWKAVIELAPNYDSVEGKKTADVSVKVNPGAQYKLKEIAWQHATALTTAELNSNVPMRPGDICSRLNIQRGMEYLRSAYWAKGYTQITAVPMMKYDDQARTIALIFDVSEGPKDGPELQASICRNVVSPSAGKTGTYVPVHDYDPKRDSLQDVKDAVTEANRTRRNVLVETGGNWCLLCRLLDPALHQAEVQKIQDENFIVVKADPSDYDKNKAFWDRFPKVPTAPHLFVLDPRGNLIASSDSSEFAQEHGYNSQGIADFLRKWSPQNAPVKCGPTATAVPGE
jgi:hypothetical protein